MSGTRAWWLDALDQLSATPFPLCAEHVGEVCLLPPIHKDRSIGFSSARRP
jgi:hypothetical protein